MPTNKQSFALALMCVVFAGSTLVWLQLDRVPPNWDDAWYLTNSLVLYDSLTQDGVFAYVGKFFSVLGFKAPLITALPTPIYLVLGRRWHLAYLVNIVSMVVLVLSVFAIARKLWNPRAALIAAYIVGTMPLLYGLARWYMVEYALTATVALAIYLLIRSEHLKQTRAAVLLGVVCGFGLLLKLSLVVYLLPAFLYAWLKSGRRRFLLAAVPCAILALPWYALHGPATMEFALSAGYGEIVSGTGPMFLPSSIGKYLVRVVNEGMSPYYVLMAVLFTAFAAMRRGSRDLFRGLVRSPRVYLFLWTLPFLVFVFASNKDVRWVAPVLPAFAIFFSILLDSVLRTGRLATAVLSLVLAFPLISMFSVSFGFPVKSVGVGYARPYDPVGWPLAEMIDVVAAHSSLRSTGKNDRILMGTDRAAFNTDNLQLTAVSARLPLVIETTAYEKDLNVLLGTLRETDFFVYKQGGETESPLLNRHQAALVREVIDGGQFQEIPFGRVLPDGGVARIFKNSRPRWMHSGAYLPAGLEQPADLAVDFGGMLQLTGLSFTESADGLEVKFRWRAVAPSDREYWCFTHVLDSRGNMVLNLDHKILGGEPPLVLWKTGDAAIERVRAALPPEIVGGVSLRFGLYHPESGDRLKITPLSGAAKGRFAVVDDSTALLTR